jgi:hypothetical protein
MTDTDAAQGFAQHRRVGKIRIMCCIFHVENEHQEGGDAAHGIQGAKLPLVSRGRHSGRDAAQH